MRRSKLFYYLFILICISWIGWNTYTYFFSETDPKLFVSGIDENSCYNKDINCNLIVTDDFNVDNISIYLDQKPLIEKYKIKKTKFDYNMVIPIEKLSSGKHTLKIIVENGTYQRKKTMKEIVFYIDTIPLKASFTKDPFQKKIFQGRTLRLKFQVNKEIKGAKAFVLDREIECVPESAKSLIYECFIPIDCEDLPGTYNLRIEINDYTETKVYLERQFRVEQFPFKKQIINLNLEKVKSEREAGLPGNKLEEELINASKKSPSYKLWHGIFYTPVEIENKKQITTEFGMIRRTSIRGLYQHKALDIAAPPKSVVCAPQDGVVVIKNRYGPSGNTVVIDHGCGILSLFFHLDSFADIEVGDKIKKGNPLGREGKTGYATNYHLHWEMRINNIAVDPIEWTQEDFFN